MALLAWPSPPRVGIQDGLVLGAPGNQSRPICFVLFIVARQERKEV